MIVQVQMCRGGAEISRCRDGAEEVVHSSCRGQRCRCEDIIEVQRWCRGA